MFKVKLRVSIYIYIHKHKTAACSRISSLNKISTSGLGSDLHHTPRSCLRPPPSPSQSPSFRPYLASRPCCLLSECLALKAKEHGVGRGKTRNPPKDETLNTSIYILQVFLAGGNRIFTELLCRVQKRVWLGYNNIQCISLDFTFELEKEPGTWVIVFHQNNLLIGSDKIGQITALGNIDTTPGRL